MKLETSIRELHEMFTDMAMFVETQVTHTFSLVWDGRLVLVKCRVQVPEKAIVPDPLSTSGN